jgi:large subunit ribosomal protein L30
MLQIKLTRSPIGYNKRQKATVKALGLRKLHQVVEKEDTPDVRGMITAVSHLVVVTEGEKTEEESSNR